MGNEEQLGFAVEATPSPYEEEALGETWGYHWAITWRFFAFGFFATLMFFSGLVYAAWSLSVDTLEENTSGRRFLMLTALLVGASVAFLSFGWFYARYR